MLLPHMSACSRCSFKMPTPPVANLDVPRCKPAAFLHYFYHSQYLCLSSSCRALSVFIAVPILLHLLSYVLLTRADVPVVLVTEKSDLYAAILFTIYALLVWMMLGNVSVAVNAHAIHEHGRASPEGAALYSTHP